MGVGPGWEDLAYDEKRFPQRCKKAQQAGCCGVNGLTATCPGGCRRSAGAGAGTGGNAPAPAPREKKPPPHTPPHPPPARHRDSWPGAQTHAFIGRVVGRVMEHVVRNDLLVPRLEHVPDNEV